MSDAVGERVVAPCPENPFPLSGAKYDFWSEAHCLAAEQLDFAIGSGAPLVLFTGAEGLGKSTILRKLVEETQRHRLIGLLPQQAAYDAIPRTAVLHALGAGVAREHSDSDHSTFVESLRQAIERVGHPVVIVDDCHADRRAKISELLEISGITSGETLFKLVLVGPPELSDWLISLHPSLLGPSVGLQGMSEADTIGYVNHRLAVEEFRYMPFSEAALKRVYEYTGGTPVKVNILCTLAMDEAQARDIRDIDDDLVEACADTAGFSRISTG